MFTKLNQNLAHYLNRLAVFALALLGFSSCSSSDEEESYPPVMYGTAYSTFEIKGTVSNADSQPIKDATVTAKVGPVTESGWFGVVDVTTTGSNGEYKVNGPVASYTIRIIAEDNVTHQKDSVDIITDPSKDPNAAEHWVGGDFTDEVNIQIKK